VCSSDLNRRWKTESKFQAAYNDGISENFPEAPHTEYLPEVCKPDPGAFHDTQPEYKVFEGYLYAVHGRVTEYAIINDGRQKHQRQIPVFPIQGRCFMDR
jgi:hypothetical protein